MNKTEVTHPSGAYILAGLSPKEQFPKPHHKTGPTRVLLSVGVVKSTQNTDTLPWRGSRPEQEASANAVGPRIMLIIFDSHQGSYLVSCYS